MFVKSKVYVGGEVSSKAQVDIDRVIRETLRGIGYADTARGLDGNTCEIVRDISKQSPDIARQVDESSTKEQGAGDNGMMFGYAAANQGPELMPLPIALAHNITRNLAKARKSGSIDWLMPDGKSQVTVEYEGNVPVKIDTIVVYAQHKESVPESALREEIETKVLRQACGQWYDDDIRILINPGGPFVLGGPAADSGLTGRKIVVDTYGGWVACGGGSFSGKDPSKVDRSASYMMRYIAKNVVASGLALECTTEVAYALGLSNPVSFGVRTNGTGLMSDEKLGTIISKVFDLRPKQIVAQLDLLRPIYRKSSCYGHFGRNEPEFTWERVDMVPTLRSEAAKAGLTISPVVNQVMKEFTRSVINATLL
jgi:S-adenosylmethionine synthetase